MTEFVYAVYTCRLGWMNKGGPNGEHWPDGRYFIEMRYEPTIAIDRVTAEKILYDRVDAVSAVDDKPEKDFNVKYEHLIGVKVGMMFFYIAQHKINQ